MLRTDSYDPLRLGPAGGDSLRGDSAASAGRAAPVLRPEGPSGRCTQVRLLGRRARGVAPQQRRQHQDGLGPLHERLPRDPFQDPLEVPHVGGEDLDEGVRLAGDGGADATSG